MTYRLAIDVGPTHTTWATVASGPEGAIEQGSIESALAVAGDGQLVGGAALTAGGTVVRDFVPRLGDSAPVMVGTTPYGAEALIARLVATVVDTTRARHGGDPLAVVMVHDDGLDAYRSGLLGEAARLAGVATTATVLLPRAEAAAAGGGSAVAGAAKVGWQRVPDPPAAAGAGGAALGVAGGVAAAAAGVTTAAAMMGDTAAATAAAAAPAVGPLGTPLPAAGPAGTPLTPAGPAGTPLQPAGPTGTPLQPAGPTGTPLQPAGPAGTPMQPPAPGPAGTPLQPPAAGPGGTPLPGATPVASVTTGVGTPKPGLPKWVKIAVGTAVVAAVGVGVALIVTKDDPKTTSSGASGVADPTTVSPDGTAGVVTDTTLAAGGGSASGGSFDVTPLLGAWQAPCQPYLAGGGGSAQSYDVSSPGPDQLDVAIIGADYTTVDCSDAGTPSITVTYHMTVTNAGQQADVQAWSLTPSAPPDCVSSEPAACAMATGASQAMALGINSAGLLLLGDPSAGVDANGFPTTWEPNDVAGTRK